MLANIQYLGVGAIAFLAFIVFCIMKGGNGGKDQGDGGGSSKSSAPTNNNNGGSDGSQN